MSVDIWIGRIASAAVGTVVYHRLFQPDWRSPALFLYDVPTLAAAFAFGGATLHRLSSGHAMKACPRLAALMVAVGLAAAAQYYSWPLSGHLTVAVTVGTLEAADNRNPHWLRAAVLLPIALLVLIRTFWPQSALMGSPSSTMAALFAGALPGGGALLLTGSRLAGEN